MTASPVSVVVPLLDEAASVDELVARLGAALGASGRDFEVIVVDDGSRDGTVARLRALEREHAWLRVVELTRNFGQIPALVCGLELARGEVVVTMDGDLQDPPEEIPRLLAAVDAGAEIASAVRLHRQQAAWRLAGGAVVHAVARQVTGVRLRDFGGQFRAYRREAIDATLAVWSEGKPFFPLALWLGFRVEEVPVQHAPRRSGGSRYTLPALLLLNLDLITSFTTAPLLAMFAAGASLLALALLAMLAGAGGAPASGAALATACGVLLSAGGLLGLYLARVYRIVAGGRRLHVVRRGPLRDTRSREPADESAQRE